ncbi:hypothetical protein RUND412_006697 [Rhizina undulata]
MSYTPLRLSGDENSYVPPSPTFSRHDQNASQMSSSPKLQLKYDRLSLALDKPLQANESGMNSILSLVRSMDSTTSYELVGNDSDSDCDDVEDRNTPESKKSERCREEDEEEESDGSDGEYLEDDYRLGPHTGSRTHSHTNTRTPMSDSGLLVPPNPAGAPCPHPHTASLSPSLKTHEIRSSSSSVYSSFSSSFSPPRRRDPDPVAGIMARDSQLDGPADAAREVVSAADAGVSGVHHNEYTPYDASRPRVSYLETVIPTSSFIDESDPTFAYTPEVDHHRYYHPNPHNPSAPSGSGLGGIYDEPTNDDVRPTTSNSQGTTADFFKDFDGVHFMPDPPQPRARAASQSFPRPVSYARPPSSGGSQGGGLIYYPAPVPAMLNLPPLISKSRNNNHNSNRLSQHIPPGPASAPLDKANRRSLAYPPQGNVAVADNRQSVASIDQLARRSLVGLPPALRASQYFDSHTPQIAPEVKEGSAMATLDSILDASARAPINAFTDHPMSSASHGRSSSSASALPSANSYRNSTAILVKRHPGESPRESLEEERLQPPEIDTSNNRYSAASLESLQQQAVPNEAPPTTLLAELESRQKQQRSRNRTAASAFPNGIRSTLLQLDAVAQVQKEQRRNRRTTLAWEDPEGAVREEEDEDVPLGMLFGQGQVRRSAGAGIANDEDVPLGLLVKKEMEDSEPLSRRRERLKATQPHPAPTSAQPSPAGPPEEEEETLAQRLKRLKGEEKRKSTATFGDGSLGLSFDGKDAPEEEETLAQRRRRLQKETKIGHRKSMVSLGQAPPPAAMAPRGLLGALGPVQRPHTGGGHPMPMGYPGQTQMGMGRGPMPMQMGKGAPGMGMGGMEDAPLDPRQRDMVERWRASVM